MNCEKYKKKFYIGIGLIIIMALMKPLSGELIDVLGIEFFIIIAMILQIIGLYLGLPYVTCISEYNKRGKPPFQKS